MICPFSNPVYIIHLFSLLFIENAIAVTAYLYIFSDLSVNSPLKSYIFTLLSLEPVATIFSNGLSIIYIKLQKLNTPDDFRVMLHFALLNELPIFPFP